MLLKGANYILILLERVASTAVTENRFNNISFQTVCNCTIETRASPFQRVASVPEDLPRDQPRGSWASQMCPFRIIQHRYNHRSNDSSTLHQHLNDKIFAEDILPEASSTSHT